MAVIPFLLVLEQALIASGTGTLTYTVPANEELTLMDMVFQSTGIFNITDIRDSSGAHYTNASGVVEIPSAVLANGANNFNSLKSFSMPLVITGGKILYIDIEDASVLANTVTLVFSGSRKTGV